MMKSEEAIFLIILDKKLKIIVFSYLLSISPLLLISSLLNLLIRSLYIRSLHEIR